jgi:Domain of unknown function (DUF4129)
MRSERFHPESFFSEAGRWFAAVLLLALMACASSTLQARDTATPIPADPVYDAPSFVKELNRLTAGLENARHSPEQLRAFRASLPKQWVVESQGRSYAVPSSLLAERLLQAEREPQSRARQIDQARDYLDALAAEAETLTGHAPQSTDSARASLNTILARPEYHRRHGKTWWQKFRDRINDAISNTIDRLLGHLGGEKPLGYALLWIGVCAAAMLIAYWIFRLWFRAARVTEMALQASAIPVRSWQEWIVFARTAAGRGDYRGAVHCSYWAGIAHLQELGALAPDRTRTPREYLRALSKSNLPPAEAWGVRNQALHRLTSRLEETWYGYQLATDADFRDSLAQLEILGCQLP